MNGAEQGEQWGPRWDNAILMTEWLLGNSDKQGDVMHGGIPMSLRIQVWRDAAGECWENTEQILLISEASLFVQS